MNHKLIRDIGRSQRLEILLALKREGGLSVKELATRFGMSYMGVKQHCLDLAEEGYLDTWRRAKARGRPEMLYRLTQRALDLFPGVNGTLSVELLEAVEKTYGPAAPPKLLFGIFNQRVVFYQAKVESDSLFGRAERFAALRDAEGYLAEATPAGYAARRGRGPGAADVAQLRITEHHSPIEDILRRYPIVARLERELFERVLRCPVRREETSAAGIYRCTFHLGPAT